MTLGEVLELLWSVPVADFLEEEVGVLVEIKLLQLLLLTPVPAIDAGLGLLELVMVGLVRGRKLTLVFCWLIALRGLEGPFVGVTSPLLIPVKQKIKIF